MVIRSLFAAALLAVSLSKCVCAATEREFRGHVTDAVSAVSFQVDGKSVECVPGATYTYLPTIPGTLHGERECRQRTLGESLTVQGVEDRSGIIRATSITLQPQRDTAVKGVAIIEAVLPPAAQALAAFRADGYELLLNNASTTQFSAGTPSRLPDITPNTWIAYTGALQPDGSVVVKTASFRSNSLERGESKLRTKSEFDAAAVTEDQRQGTASRFFRGRDYKRIPAHHDSLLQQRIDRIGQSLVPVYQRDMAADNPMRLNVRFQIVDDKGIATMGLGSGIVLVPYREVAPLQNDSQVAALLGCGLSDALSKHDLAWAKLHFKENIAGAAAIAANFFTFGTAGTVTSIVSASHEATVERLQAQHNLRESMLWMHDAGYDLREAPKVWWLIDAEGRPLAKQPVPLESAYVYRLLDTVWKTAAASFAGPARQTSRPQ